MEKLNYKQIMDQAREYIAENQPKTEAPTAVADLLRPLVADEVQEVFYVILLDVKHQVIKIHEATRGLVDRSHVDSKVIFREAIMANASRIILAHNHPSGDPAPSTQDINVTKKLIESGKILGIEVLDHVIIGKRTPNRPKDWLSLREEGMLIGYWKKSA